MSPYLLLCSHVSPSVLLCPRTLNNKTVNLIFPFLPTFLFMILKLIYREWSLCVPWWWATSSEVCSFTEKTHFGWFFFFMFSYPFFSISPSPSLLPFPSSSHRKIQVSFNEKIQNPVSFISLIYVKHFNSGNKLWMNILFEAMH